MKDLNGIDGGLIVTAIVTGVLMAPACGVAPLIGLLAAVGTSVYIAGMLFRRR